VRDGDRVAEKILKAHELSLVHGGEAEICGFPSFHKNTRSRSFDSLRSLKMYWAQGFLTPSVKML
jgi:uncharacterized membrane protein YsdA (DUF1294 family)